MAVTPCFLLLLGMGIVVLKGDAQEVRIPAYATRLQNKPIVRIIPSGATVIRLRQPDQAKPVTNPQREASITRLQPVLLAPKVLPRINLEDVLLQMRLRSMASLVSRTKLQQFLRDAGPVTLFAPTDEAFSLTTLPSDPDRLQDFVLQHIVKGQISPQDLRNDVTTPSLRSGERPLRFNVYEDGQMLTVSGSQFLDDATDADSIRIQPIDRVLYPISNEDLVSQLKLTFPSMFQHLLDSSLTPQLTSGTFTVFAPTDTAFEELPEDVRQNLFNNPTLMRKVLLNHVVPGTHYSAVLAHGYSVRTLGGEPIHFTNRRGLILANGIPVVKSDISVNNGVIHAVNRLLLPPELHPRRRPATVAPPPGRTFSPIPSYQSYSPPVPTYVEPAPLIPRTLTKTMVTPLHLPDGRNETFSTANSLFRRSLLLSTVKNNGDDFTIVMPTDGAFNALDPGALDQLRRNTRLLRRMLMHQMLEGKLNLSDVSEQDRPVRSLGGTIIISSVDGGKSLMAGGARVLSIRPAANGLVLVTDRVTFPPPARTVAEALTPLTSFKTVVDQKPAMHSLLTSEEAVYTVFAPTDAAIAGLPAEQQHDSKFMSELFWSHVVPGAYYRNRLSPGLRLTTLRGYFITIQRNENDEVLANGVPLSGHEILAGNGVIHKLDGVLFTPPLPTSVQSGVPIISRTRPSAVEPEDELSKIARMFNATNFLDWMEKANMRNILQTQVSRTRGCTLFLPTDAALNNMSPTLRTSTLGNPRRLQRFVLYHVSPRVLRWDSIRNNAMVPTLLSGKNIRCNIYAKDRQPGVLSVSGCRVSAMRPLQENVTVAVIEDVLKPPTGNLPIVVSQTPFLSNFSKVMKVSGVNEIIKDDGPYTLFAPEACVFSKMTHEEYHQLITNKKVALEFVKRYLVRGCYYSSGFYDGQILMTEAGTELHINVTPECILVSGVRVLYGDMGTTDGVLHVVSGQLPS